MKSKYHVYLAGPITGLSYDEARFGWRHEFVHMVDDHIICKSPMRGKDFLVGHKKLPKESESYNHIHPMVTQKGVTTRDRFDCTTADLIVMNLKGATNVSIGTMIEIGWADANRIPIVLIMEKGNIHDHMMVKECAGYIVDDLEDAANLVNWIFSERV